jgi:hypothetical protein
MHEDPGRIFLGPQDIANIVAESEGELYLPFHSPKMTSGSEGDLSESQAAVPGDGYQRTPSSIIQENPSMDNPNACSAADLQFDELAEGNPRLRWAGTRRYIDDWILQNSSKAD